jgi:hypothetical protein
MEDHMPEPTTSAGGAAPLITEDQAIRQRVKGLTSQVLQQGRVDPEAVRDVVRAMIGRTPGNAAGKAMNGRRSATSTIPIVGMTDDMVGREGVFGRETLSVCSGGRGSGRR